MAVRPNPLVPLELFRRRNFAVVNLSTLVIYGALYVSLTFQSLFLQGTIGYSPLAAGALGLPAGILLAVLSTPAGRLAGRFGARPFMVAGPLLMAAGLAWLSRIPPTSTPWVAEPRDPASLIPPSDYFVDVFPGSLLFGVGLALLVAPLTTALMSSVPVRRAGLGSAINNAISRVGAPLASAGLFIVITRDVRPGDRRRPFPASTEPPPTPLGSDRSLPRPPGRRRSWRRRSRQRRRMRSTSRCWPRRRSSSAAR